MKRYRLHEDCMEQDADGEYVRYDDAQTEVEILEAEVKSLRFNNAMHTDHCSGSYWVWQGDGSDHPESIACPVLITPGQLRKWLALEAGNEE